MLFDIFYSAYHHIKKGEVGDVQALSPMSSSIRIIPALMRDGSNIDAAGVLTKEEEEVVDVDNLFV